jgi:hypothetical protein
MIFGSPQQVPGGPGHNHCHPMDDSEKSGKRPSTSHGRGREPQRPAKNNENNSVQTGNLPMAQR